MRKLILSATCLSLVACGGVPGQYPPLPYTMAYDVQTRSYAPPQVDAYYQLPPEAMSALRANPAERGASPASRTTANDEDRAATWQVLKELAFTGAVITGMGMVSNSYLGGAGGGGSGGPEAWSLVPQLVSPQLQSGQITSPPVSGFYGSTPCRGTTC